MKEHQMYEHNPNSAESILNEKMSAISHAWLDDQRAAVIEAMKEHATNEVAKYKTVIEKLLPLGDGYCTYLSGVLDYIPNDGKVSGSYFPLEKTTEDVDYEYIKGWGDGIAYANSSAILKDFIEYLQDRHFVDDDVWQEKDVIKEFLNEKETRREA